MRGHIFVPDGTVTTAESIGDTALVQPTQKCGFYSYFLHFCNMSIMSKSQPMQPREISTEWKRLTSIVLKFGAPGLAAVPWIRS
jgi:hypothetical protein